MKQSVVRRSTRRASFGRSLVASSARVAGVLVVCGFVACSSNDDSAAPGNGADGGAASAEGGGETDGRAPSEAGSDGGGAVFGGAVTHGDQLTIDHVGPWTLQKVARGSEALTKPTRPGEGFFRLDSGVDEGLLSDAPFVGSDADVAHLNAPTNHGGKLTADTMIDGFLVPAGTYVVQFEDLPGIYAQSVVNGNYLFRGCRFRNTGDTFNTAYAGDGFHFFVHYCDFGGDGPNDTQDGGGFLHILGGTNHRVLRSFFQYVGTAIQPNVNGMLIEENWIDHVAYYFGEGGPDGDPATSDNYHINGVSSEGGLSSLRILRNHIFVPSPDGSVAPSYGAPNRIVPQTDCIALFQSLGGAYPGDDTTGIQVRDNLLAGAGYVIYGGGAGSKNIKITGNEISTRFWTNGGGFGPFADDPGFGTNGNEASNNTWLDDYGTGGDGIQPTTSREHPNGDGPKKGTPAF